MQYSLYMLKGKVMLINLLCEKVLQREGSRKHRSLHKLWFQCCWDDFGLDSNSSISKPGEFGSLLQFQHQAAFSISTVWAIIVQDFLPTCLCEKKMLTYDIPHAISFRLWFKLIETTKNDVSSYLWYFPV